MYLNRIRGYYFWAKTQNSPGKFLVEYIEWVENHYTVDEEAKSLKHDDETFVLVPEPGPDTARRSRKSNRERLRLIPRDAEKCKECTVFDRSGSNAFQERKACLDCGAVTIVKYEKSIGVDPETCLHENVNRPGSSKTVSRTFCLDCRTYINEEPQTELTRGTRGPNSVGPQRVPVDTRPNPELAAEQALKVAKTFPCLLKAHVRRMSEGAKITQRELEAILTDAADIAIEDRDDETPRAPHVAMMFAKAAQSHRDGDSTKHKV